MAAINLGTVEVADAGHCKNVRACFTAPARRLVGRVCRGFLDTMILTGSELVSSADYQERMVEHGQEMQRAVQLLSGAQARVFNLDLHKRMREIFKLQDLATQLIAKLNETIGNEKLTPGEGSAWYQSLRSRVPESDLEVAVCIALTTYLANSESWGQKTAMLLDFLEQESDPDFVAAVDSFVADVIDSPAAMRELMGNPANLGARMEEFIGLYQGGNYEATSPDGPFPQAERLNTLLANKELPLIRGSIEQQMLRAMESGTPLSRTTGLKELLALCDLNEHLTSDGGDIIGGDLMGSEIEKRMGRLVSHDNLEKLLSESETTIERITALTRLQKRLVGGGTSKQINDYIKYQFERRGFEQELLDSAEGVSQKLRVVAQLYEMIEGTDLPDSLRERLLKQLETIQMNFIKKNKILARINEQSGNAVQTVGKLADLCRSGVLTKGENLGYVQMLIRTQIGTQDFMNTLLSGVSGDAEKNKRLAQLRKRLEEAGIRDGIQSGGGAAA